MPLLCIHNARLVSSHTIRDGGVVIGEDGKIERVMAAGEPPAMADTTIDAQGLLLFPGFIDAHVHMRDPGAKHKEDFDSGSIAAACGGVTTVMCMPNTIPAVTDMDGFMRARHAGECHSHIDFTLQGAITRNNLDTLAELWSAGITSFETLMSDAPENDRLNLHYLYATVSEIARLRAVLGIYTGHQELLEHRLGELRNGSTDLVSLAGAREPLGEVVGIAIALEACRTAAIPTVFRQVSTARGLEILRHAKKLEPRFPISVEVTPHHLHLEQDQVKKLRGFAYMIPPLRSHEDRKAVVAALADGTVDFVGSDHAPHHPDEKSEQDPWRVPGGTPGLDTLVSAVLDLAARKIISYMDVARVLSERPAALFGIAHAKGHIRVGADGDLVLVDPEACHVVSQRNIRSRATRSPFEGQTLVGRSLLTVLRGLVIAEQDRFLSKEPQGRFVPRNGFRSAS